MRAAPPFVVLSMLLIVVANVLYHWGQKSVPGEVPLLASLAQTFATALLLTLLALPLAVDAPVAGIPAWINWKSVAVGAAIFGVEMGFLAAYRAGWPLNTASLTAAAALAVVLVPLGSMLFRETWSAEKTAGLLLCLAGLWLLNRS